MVCKQLKIIYTKDNITETTKSMIEILKKQQLHNTTTNTTINANTSIREKLPPIIKYMNLQCIVVINFAKFLTFERMVATDPTHSLKWCLSLLKSMFKDHRSFLQVSIQFGKIFYFIFLARICMCNLRVRVCMQYADDGP